MIVSGSCMISSKRSGSFPDPEECVMSLFSISCFKPLMFVVLSQLRDVILVD